MKTVPYGLALVLAVATPLASHAARPREGQLSPQFSSCMDRAGGVTQNMIDCSMAETQRQDARLNKAYKALMGSLSAERKKQLLEAQRAWLKFRDTNCGFYFDPDGGSMARVSANDCVMTMTANRAKELEDLAQ